MGLGDHSGVMVRLHSSGIDRSRRRDAEDDHGEPCWKGSEKHAGRMPVWRVSLRLCIARAVNGLRLFGLAFVLRRQEGTKGPARAHANSSSVVAGHLFTLNSTFCLERRRSDVQGKSWRKNGGLGKSGEGDKLSAQAKSPALISACTSRAEAWFNAGCATPSQPPPAA